MPGGILIVDKPAGWTSMDVCAKLRGILGERRVGHAGTLDPMATGVLPVFVGRATRAVEFATQCDKEYVAQLQLGIVTNTQDTTGQVLEEHPVEVTRGELEALLPRFTGPISQLPPMYSAVKINGKKLYELARKDREVERQPRMVTVHALAVEGQEGPGRFTLRVRCSKGTYVRTLCHDIGRALGCGGCMAALRRTMAAGFTLEDAVALETVGRAEDPAALLRPVDSLFSQYGALTLTGRAVFQAKNGCSLPCTAPDGRYRVYSGDGEFLLLGQAKAGRLTTVKSFFAV